MRTLVGHDSPPYRFLKHLSNAIFGHIALYESVSYPHSLVVIKTMNIESMNNNTSLVDNIPVLEDGKLEAKIMKKLPPHPNVLQRLDCFRDNENQRLVLEYCPNGDLYNHIVSLSRLNGDRVALVRPFIKQIVNGMAHLHSHGVAHRDLSLENVLLDSKLTCKISDFGLATYKQKRVRSVTSVGVGKPYYMSPEVYNNVASYDPFKSDVWALGILIFILLTGHPLYEVPNDENYQLLVEAMRSKGHPFARFWQRYRVQDADLVRILDNVLVLNPEKRWSMKKIQSVLRNNNNAKVEEQRCCTSCKKHFRFYRKKKYQCPACETSVCRKCYKSQGHFCC